MKKICILLVILTSVLLSCTENQRAKKFGGEFTINLPPNQKLVNATWKEQNLWYLTEPMDSDYKPKDKLFKEESNFGVMEGTVIFHEIR